MSGIWNVRSLTAITLATCAVGLHASSAAADKLCAPYGFGVPGLNEPPKWTAFTEFSGPIKTIVDDPRWVGAGGNSYGNETFAAGDMTGAASAAADVRAVYSPDPTTAGRKFLYLSYTARVQDVDSAEELLVFFRIGASVGPSPAPQFALRFRISEIVSPEVDPVAAAFTACTGTDATCIAAAPDFYSVYQGVPATACLTSPAAECMHYDRIVDPTTWVASSARFWRNTDSWTVSLRVPVSASSSFADGIQDGQTAIAYQVSVATPLVEGYYPWPRTLQKTEADFTASPVTWIEHADLRADARWGELALTDPWAPPADCLGIAVEGLGVLYDQPGGADLNAGSLSTDIIGTKDVSGVRTPVKNTFVVRVRNRHRDRDISPGTLQARFRIADWGVQMIADPTAPWHDVPVDSGTNPTGNVNQINRESVTPDTNKGAVGVEWTLDSTERCNYHIGDPGDACPLPSDPGYATNPKRQLYDDHQCIVVDLTGSGDFDFVSRGIYQNHNFGRMSIYPREAMISAAGIPTWPDQKEHEIYLFVAPRNMPATLPAGTEGIDLIAGNAAALAETVREGYRGLDDGQNNNDNAILSENERARFLKMREARDIFGGDDIFERPIGDVLDIPQGQENPDDQAFPVGVRASLRDLDQVARIRKEMGERVSAAQVAVALQETVAPATLARLLPTLEIYAFYWDGTIGGNGKKHLVPLSAFTLFLHHDGPIEGLQWVLDGAEKQSNNVYLVRVPLDPGRRRIQVRAQAIEPGQSAIRPDPSWPCPPVSGGGCCHPTGTCSAATQLSNAGLAGLAGLLALGFRRRRKK